MIKNYDAYAISKEKYKRLFASYLQTEGTQLMNKVRLQYDLINNYKEQIIEMWKLFDIDYLENLYITWKRANPTSEDSEWKYTEFLENICKSFQITREYYSYYAITEGLATTNLLLNNLHMIRRLKIRRAAVGFDGTRESLVEILRNSLNNRYSSEANAEIKFILRTVTEVGKHAVLQVYIMKPASDDVIWNEYDDYLVYDGEYFVQLLGIEAICEPLTSDTLVYDLSNFDDSNYR